MVSMFKSRFVKNFTVMIYSVVANYGTIWNLGPSLCERESPFHCFVSSSMEKLESLTFTSDRETNLFI